MHPDLPFITARSALKNCVGHLYEAKEAESENERIDSLDGACQYAQQALDAFHDAAFYYADIGSDLPGVRQLEMVREVVDGNAHSAYGQLKFLTDSFVGVALEKIIIKDIRIDAIESFMDAYAGNIAMEDAYNNSLEEPG